VKYEASAIAILARQESRELEGAAQFGLIEPA
jgi:hypothetical protein